MQITKPVFYNEFSCIADACPDTCCAGWQIMIDKKSLNKYRKYRGIFRNRLHNDIDWKEQSFRQYDRRCTFLNEENLCDIYSEAGPDMLCDTCRKYPRHIEEFEGLRELSLSLSCPEAARIFLSHKEKIQFITVEKDTVEESYEDFDYFLFTALMDTRDYLFSVIQDRTVPVKLRCRKLLACAHDFQLSLDKNELFQWETIRKRHEISAFSNSFQKKICQWIPAETSGKILRKQIWKTILPKMEVLRPGWHDYLRNTLTPLYTSCTTEDQYQDICREFEASCPDWKIQEEQLLLYWTYTYFCGAVYDEMIFAKAKMAVICTFMIHELAMGTWLQNNKNFTFQELVSICYRFSRELEHSDQNLNAMEDILDENQLFSLGNLLIL